MICTSLQKRSRDVSRRRVRRQIKEGNSLKIDPYLPKLAKWKKTLLEVSIEKLKAVKSYVGMKNNIYIRTNVCIHQNSGSELKKEKSCVLSCCVFFVVAVKCWGWALAAVRAGRLKAWGRMYTAEMWHPRSRDESSHLKSPRWKQPECRNWCQSLRRLIRQSRSIPSPIKISPISSNQGGWSDRVRTRRSTNPAVFWLLQMEKVKGLLDRVEATPRRKIWGLSPWCDWRVSVGIF